MIDYAGGKFHPNLLFKLRGSVYPYSVAVALPAAILSVIAKIYFGGGEDGLVSKDAVLGVAWSSVSSLLGFVIVFRTSQAYNRFWEGAGYIYQMMGFWHAGSSSLVAFNKGCKADVDEVLGFQHTLVRLVSILNAVVLIELSQSPSEGDSSAKRSIFEMELIDAEGIDAESLEAINQVDCKAELVMHWIVQLIAEHDQRGCFGVSPPVLSRAYQELATGMVKFHEAKKLADIPLPFPYMQTMELLLVLHWMATPCLTAMWVESAAWAGMLSFMQIFFVWSLNIIATELENPYGHDTNDLPVQRMQLDMNKRMLMLLRPACHRTAQLSINASLEESQGEDGIWRFGSATRASERGVWHSGSSAAEGTGSAVVNRSVRISMANTKAIIQDSAKAPMTPMGIEISTSSKIGKQQQSIGAAGLSAAHPGLGTASGPLASMGGAPSAGRDPMCGVNDAHAAAAAFRAWSEDGGGCQRLLALCEEIRDALRQSAGLDQRRGSAAQGVFSLGRSAPLNGGARDPEHGTFARLSPPPADPGKTMVETSSKHLQRTGNPYSDVCCSYTAAKVEQRLPPQQQPQMVGAMWPPNVS